MNYPGEMRLLPDAATGSRRLGRGQETHVALVSIVDRIHVVEGGEDIVSSMCISG